MSDIKNYLTEIVIFFTGGGIIGILNYFREKKKDNTDEFKELLNYLKEMLAERDKKIDDMEAKFERNINEINKLKDELSELKSKLMVMESAHFDIPFPMWLKSLDGKMISLNSEYEKHFLIPSGKTAKDYIGKTDHDVWGVEIGKIYAFHDNMTLKSKNGYWSGKETVILNETDYTEQWTMVKYVRYSGKTPIGIGGIAIPILIQ